VYFHKALEIDPNNVGVWNNKGTAFYEQERYEDAIKYYDKALEIDPNNVNVLNSKCFAFRSLRKYEQADN
jgi:tetratricopeptide (TPR) repeat protein